MTQTPEYDRTFSRLGTTERVSLLGQLAVIGGLLIVYYADPVTWARLVAEDHIGEFASAIAMLLACALFSIIFLRASSRNGWYGLLALGTFFIGMEEISWGQRLADIATPEAFSKVNSQRELTLHNIPGVEPGRRMYLFTSFLFLSYGVVLPILSGLSAGIRSLLDRFRLPVPRVHLAPIFFATAYLLAMNPRVAPTLLPLISPMAKAIEVSELLMALALGSLAVDELLRRVRWSPREANAPAWLAAALFALPLAWLAPALFLVPSVIETAYHGESLAFLNGLIENSAGRPVDYYLETWTHVTWVVFGNGLLAAAAIVALLRYRPLPRLRPNGWTANAAFALPTFYVVSFGIATSLSLVADGHYNLSFRLNDHMARRLPALGHYAQAEKIATFLEANPDYARDDFFLQKGRLMQAMGRPDEAKQAFEHALEVEEARHAKSPGDPRVLRRLALLHAHLGNDVLAYGFFDRALEAYVEVLEGVDDPARIGRLLTERAQIFVDIGAQELAIDAYLHASRVAEDAELRLKLAREIYFNLGTCGQLDGYRPQVDGYHREAVEWNRVEEMQRRLSDGGAGTQRWCPTGDEHALGLPGKERV